MAVIRNAVVVDLDRLAIPRAAISLVIGLDRAMALLLLIVPLPEVVVPA